jgi:hypothetical protein
MLNIPKIMKAAVLFSGFSFLSHHAFALEVNDKFWLSAVVDKPLTEDHQWRYLIYTSTRFIDTRHPWQMAIIEGALGYNIRADQTLWAGYRWNGIDPNNKFVQVNFLLQQLSWRIKDTGSYYTKLRSRFEEFMPNHINQVAVRLRERFFVEFPVSWIGRIHPVVYDEIFFQLNNTTYTSHSLFSQNRLFLGFNYVVTHNTFWEIGYMNQYVMNTPVNPENELSHVISATFNVN